MIYNSNLLQGEKVYLTGLSKEDLAGHYQWFSNPEFLRLFSGNPARPATKEAHEAWFEEASKDQNYYNFSIFTQDAKRLVGNCNVELDYWSSPTGWLAIMIGEPSDWGKGYGTDAMQILIRFCFMELNLHRVSLSVFAYNTRAIKSYEKLGFVHEGAKREALYRDGIYHDMLLMGMLRREWLMKHHPQIL